MVAYPQFGMMSSKPAQRWQSQLTIVHMVNQDFDGFGVTSIKLEFLTPIEPNDHFQRFGRI